MIGQNFAYYDTLHVPVQTPDSVFQFQITAVDIETHQPAPDLPVELRLDDAAYTQINDTTDLSGTVTITYDNNAVDTITYNIFTESNRWPGYYGQTQAIKGIPEIITLGVAEEF